MSIHSNLSKAVADPSGGPGGPVLPFLEFFFFFFYKSEVYLQKLV